MTDTAFCKQASYQNTFVKIQSMEKEASPACGIFPESSDYMA